MVRSRPGKAARKNWGSLTFLEVRKGSAQQERLETSNTNNLEKCRLTGKYPVERKSSEPKNENYMFA